MLHTAQEQTSRTLWECAPAEAHLFLFTLCFSACVFGLLVSFCSPARLHETIDQIDLI